MRSECIEYKIYTYEELSEDAKETALMDFRDTDCYYDDDNIATLDKFKEIFPIKNVDWEYGNYNGYINFKMDCEYEEIEEFTGVRLLKYLWNNYKTDLFQGKWYSLYSKTEKSEGSLTMGELKSKHSKIILDSEAVLTGCYSDDRVLDPIYDFMNKPSNNVSFTDLMETCLNNWIEGCEKDYEYYYSEECFIENTEGNGWEYTEDGKLY